MSKTKNTNDSAPFDTFEDLTSFVPNFDDVYDEVVLPVGTEAQIQIVSVDTGTDKKEVRTGGSVARFWISPRQKT
jgi:hypothetical protein